MVAREVEKSAVKIYTDGGCSPNPGMGGWGAVLLYDGHRKELSGAAQQTTNNRMELTAAIQALRALKRPCDVVIYTDSEYLKKGVTQWLPGWKRRGWLRKTGPVKNEDLWKTLDALSETHKIDWRWLRGHAGHRENERCDQLATEAREALHRNTARSKGRS